MHVKILIVIFCLSGVDSSEIQDKVGEFFKRDIVKKFEKHWRSYRKNYENAIQKTLKYTYGHRGMNIYVRQPGDTLKICTGLYGSDNVIDWLLLDTKLISMPNLIMPEVVFALASNFLRVEAGLSKMILEAEYMLLRNQTNIEFLETQQTLHKSPFSYGQVQPHGQLAIIAEDCKIEGYVVTKLEIYPIYFGHNTFRVKKCKFSVEISKGQNPPIIAPYFSMEQSKQLEFFLTRPIQAEMLTKLQALVFPQCGLGILEPFKELRDNYQVDNIFEETSKYVKDIAMAINNKTIEEDKSSVSVPLIRVTWNSECQEELCSGDIMIYDMYVYQLDTLYSANTGGPIKMQSARITEALRFDTIMVKGRTKYLEVDQVFVAEIHDVAVDFEIYLEKPEATFEVVGWRSFEFWLGDTWRPDDRQKAQKTFVRGYIVNMLPTLLKNHLINMYKHLSIPKMLGGMLICDPQIEFGILRFDLSLGGRITGRIALDESSSSSDYYGEDKQPYDTDDDRYTTPGQNKTSPKPSNYIKAGSDDFLRDYSGNTTESDDNGDDVFPNSRSDGYNTHEYHNQKLSHVQNDGNDGQELGDERNDGDDDGSQETMKLAENTTFGDDLYDGDLAGGVINGKNKSKVLGTRNPTDLLAKQETIYEKKGRKNEDDTILDPDFDKNEEEREVSHAEYADYCSSVCPIADMMICARLIDNGHVYFRNFFSFCDIQRQRCLYPYIVVENFKLDFFMGPSRELPLTTDRKRAELRTSSFFGSWLKKLEIVSRQPCDFKYCKSFSRVNSSKFFEDDFAPPKLSGSGGEDPVLKYIRCRELGRLEQDPRCQF